MNDPVRIELLPAGRRLTVARGTPLQDVLFAEGVEFPCGGHGRCKGCRVQVLAGALPVSADEARLLTPAELAEGRRLACRARADTDLTLELAQWEAPILADDSVFTFTPREGLGVAVDLGTTTLAAQLLDLRTGQVLAVRTALNAQARHGADIMSRIELATHGGAQVELTRLIREQIGGLIASLLEHARVDAARLQDIVLVGNTAMHHLFCGLSVEPLARHPFEPEQDGSHAFRAAELGWTWATEASACVLPCLGGFVGSDLLAGVLATKQAEADALTVLVDLGTNGEIVVGNRARLLCASTAAGPAFEGARISRGMRAATGAVSTVSIHEGQLRCHVIGETMPRGICGSGLVDAVACGLELGRIHPDGRLANGGELPLAPSVALQQRDIRELQLAKAAIGAGIRILLEQWGATPADVDRVWLAGAFGNYIDRASARRIGLIAFPPEKVVPAGNTALLGAKLALVSPPGDAPHYAVIRSRMRHVPLNEDPRFLDIFTDEMAFPPTA